MADRRLDDEDLEAALGRVAARQSPDPGFRQRLGARLLADASSRRAGSAGQTSRLPTPPPTPRHRLNRRRLASAALAFAASAAAVWALAPRRPILPPMQVASTTLPGNQPVRLRAPSGRRVSLSLELPFADGLGGEPPAVRLELRDGAELAYRPDPSPTLELGSGYARVAVPTDSSSSVTVRGLAEQVLLGPGSDVAFELVHPTQGEKTMRRLWLVPTSAASGAAITLAVLVAQGQVAFSKSSGVSSPLPTGEVVVLRGGSAKRAAPHRVAELEQKVVALRQENGRLAGQLARSKGVTTESVLERIATLKQTSLAGMLAPAAMADLVTDLKGLGDEGILALIKLLESGDEKERFLAANLLEQLNSPAAVPALRKVALEDEDKMASMMASHALAFLDDASSVPALRGIAAANKSWETRVNALWGLCKHGDQKAIAESLAIMQDDGQPPELRGALGSNLLLLHDPELLPIVDETVRQFGKMEQVGTLAIEYYKAVNIPEARTRLEAMAADAALPEPVRKAARDALGGNTSGR